MKNLLIVTDQNNNQMRIDLDKSYPDCSFKLIKEVKPKKPRHLDEFVDSYLVFEPSGRAHGDVLLREFKRLYGTRLTDRDTRIAIATALRLRGADKKVVSIKGIKLQGYAGVRFK